MGHPASSGLALALMVGAQALPAALPATFAGAAQAVLALLLALVLPGLAITAALFPRRVLGFPERLLFTLGSSLAVCTLGGVLLNSTPWGLTPASWAVLLGAVTLAAGAAAWVRRPPMAGRAEAEAERPGIRLRWRESSLVGLALVMVGVALWVARTPEPAQDLQGYTMLWMVPDRAGDGRTLDLGIRSGEFAPVAFSLRLTVNNQIVREWPRIELAPNGRWETLIDPGGGPASGAPVEATLYRLDNPEKVYRNVVLKPR